MVPQGHLCILIVNCSVMLCQSLGFSPSLQACGPALQGPKSCREEAPYILRVKAGTFGAVTAS